MSSKIRRGINSSTNKHVSGIVKPGNKKLSDSILNAGGGTIQFSRPSENRPWRHSEIPTGANHRSSLSVLWSREPNRNLPICHHKVTFGLTGKSVASVKSLLWPKAQSQTIWSHRHFPVSFAGFWCQLCSGESPDVLFKPKTSLRWCDSANHCTTVLLPVSHKTHFHRTNASLGYYSQVILFCSPILLALASPACFTGTSNQVARRSVRQKPWKRLEIAASCQSYKSI